jgi:hypothetical protein
MSKTKKISSPRGVVITDTIDFLNWLDKFVSRVVSMIGVDAIYSTDMQAGKVTITFFELQKGPCELCEEYHKLKQLKENPLSTLARLSGLAEKPNSQ